MKRRAGFLVDDLRTEYLTTPMAVGAARPRFSWTVSAARRGARVTAYQVLVSSSEEGLGRAGADVWDSGRVEGDHCTHIEYGGPPLEDARRYWWAARAWDDDDEASPWGTSWFETALGPQGFSADWITLPPAPFERDDYRPARLLRREFTARERPKSARLYATALGAYELQLNGSRVGDAKLRPGWTDYHHRVQYQVYDVSDAVIAGTNAIGVILGDGRYSGHWSNGRCKWGDLPVAAAQLVLEYADGERAIVATDERWRGARGAILRSDVVLGEIYDARQERPDWSTAGYGDADWDAVMVVPRPAIDLVAERAEPVRRTQEVVPVSVTAPNWATHTTWPTHIFDLGQNIVGWTRLRVRAPRGTEIVIRHGEALADDGKLYTANLGRAEQTERYICKGDGEEIYEPTFTFHGFRYVEVRNLPEPPTEETITGVVVHSDIRPAGEFTCSEELVNRLQSNIVWTQRGNFLDVPTDCPQRNERLGWFNDARAFARTACFNYDIAAFYTKWLDDVLLARTEDGFYSDHAPSLSRTVEREGAPGWADTGVFLPWTVYEQYGDERILSHHLDAMSAFVDAMHAANPTLVRRERVGRNYGDWLSVPDANTPTGRSQVLDSVYSTTPTEVIATAFFKRSAELVARAAQVVGRDASALRFRELAEAVREAFCREFVGSDGSVLGETQTAYALALSFDLLPEDVRPAAAQRLVAAVERRGGRVSTGLIGTELLLPALAAAGRSDLAVQMLLSTDYPSWGYGIRHGATTVWERWDGWTEERGFQDTRMNSFNHYALGAVGAWMYSSLGAIELVEPGYRRIRIRPLVEPPIVSASAVHRSIRGPIRTAWSVDGNGFELAVEIPVGCTAVVHVPCRPGDVLEEGGAPAGQVAGVRVITSDDDCGIFEVGAGKYRFTSSGAIGPPVKSPQITGAADPTGRDRP